MLPGGDPYQPEERGHYGIFCLQNELAVSVSKSLDLSQCVAKLAITCTIAAMTIVTPCLPTQQP